MAVTTKRKLELTETRVFGNGATVMTDATDLTFLQTRSYEKFLQAEVLPNERQNVGLEALLRESFPIEERSGDNPVRLEYLGYELEKPQYSPDECRQLRLTYGRPWRVRFRLVTKDSAIEEDVYLGVLPIMLGGGELIINGAERVVVNQLHRSPGVDFHASSDHGEQNYGCTISPDRGSWVKLDVTKKEAIQATIDKHGKMPVMTFLRAMSPDLSTNEQLFGQFFNVEKVELKGKNASAKIVGKVSVDTLVYPSDSGNPDAEIIHAGAVINKTVADEICDSGIKRVFVVDDPRNKLLLNCFEEDKTTSHEQALMYIYRKLRPGNPAQIDKARELFNERFTDPARYRIGAVGRFRLNRKLGLDTDLNLTPLTATDVVAIVKYLNALWTDSDYISPRDGAQRAMPDDIDHLANRRIRTIDELACEELRKGFIKLRRHIQDRLHDPGRESASSPRTLINQKNISSAIDFFFGRCELSQVVDQTNPLSMLTHERRLSTLGPGGVSRKRAGFEIRDVHPSHYGRICPIETPEGQNIGLISYLSLYARVDEFGFLTAPYHKVVDGVITEDVIWMRADEELGKTFVPGDVSRSKPTKKEPLGHVLPDPQTQMVLVRKDGEYVHVPVKDVQYVDFAPNQMIGVSAGLIPFLEHDDANRALMGSNMQRQAVPLLMSEAPIVGTGLERAVALNSSLLVRAKADGVVTYVDALRIVINHTDEYRLRKFAGLNGCTCENQRPIVKLGQEVKAGDVIADGACTDNGVLALGRNVLVAFMVWDGYNYEDAVILSEELVQNDTYTSIHIETYEAEIREVKLGREQFTRDIPNVSERQTRNLDENGIVRVGTYVQRGDVLVGKTAPKNKTELTPEEKLLHAIFGRQGDDVKDESLKVPSGVEGVVIGTYHFRSRTSLSDDERESFNGELSRIEQLGNKEIAQKFGAMISEMEQVFGENFEMVNDKGEPIFQSQSVDKVVENARVFSFPRMCVWNNVEKNSKEYKECLAIYEKRRVEVEDAIDQRDREFNSMRKGDELKRGVLEMVKVYIATKRTISVGDKMAGRHGNKGVIAKILPKEDMPFLEDGTPIQIMLNPLGVPSRMNVGQILETHLGWAAAKQGYRAITPVFDGATEEIINEELEKAGLPRNGKVQLYDGRTGEPFAQETTVGYIYMLKLHHLVDDKIHARSTGPYSLITQQPLGGKARSGGQRYGEMEVWALQAYGAAYTLQELLTVKSDDVEGRSKIYNSMVNGENTLEAGMPASFDVLVNEIRGLALNMELVSNDKNKRSRANTDFTKTFGR